MNAPSFHPKTVGFPIMIPIMIYTGGMGAPPHPPFCMLLRLDSFKYIARMAMRFVKARLEKHFRVPFLHTL
jgi:hypothetical protein